MGPAPGGPGAAERACAGTANGGISRGLRETELLKPAVPRFLLRKHSFQEARTARTRVAAE